MIIESLLKNGSSFVNYSLAIKTLNKLIKLNQPLDNYMRFFMTIYLLDDIDLPVDQSPLNLEYIVQNSDLQKYCSRKNIVNGFKIRECHNDGMSQAMQTMLKMDQEYCKPESTNSISHSFIDFRVLISERRLELAFERQME